MFSVAGGGQMSLANENFRFGVYNDETVNLRRTGLRLSQLRMSTKRALLNMQHIHHLNISSLLGIFCADDVTFLVTQSCSKGALCDVLQNEKFNLDANFKHSMSADLAPGLAFLHKQDLVHGALTSLHPTEIAALLSSVVFQQKHCSEPQLCPDLVKVSTNALFTSTRALAHTQNRCLYFLVGKGEVS